MKLNKAAMFGLDARIALAIFGALSVISGAALYSAIQQSKLVSIQVTGNEIVKAVEQYMLDTGSDLPLAGTVYDVTALITDPTVTGWNGPYLPMETGVAFDTAATGLLNKDYHSILLRPFDEGWNGSSATQACKANSVCSLWINYRKVPTSIATAYDLMVDGTAGAATGNVRFIATSESGYYFLYQKYIPVLNQL